MLLEFDPKVTLSLILSVGTLIFAWYRTRRQDVDERFAIGSKRMDEHDLAISELRQAVASMPEKDDMHKLEMMLAEMGGDMKAMRATMRSLAESQGRFEKIVTRHEDHLRGSP